VHEDVSTDLASRIDKTHASSSMDALHAAIAAWPQDAQALTDLHTLQTTNPRRYQQLEQAAWEVCLQRAKGKRQNVFGPDLAFTMLELMAEAGRHLS
jgi:hypothetical protein